MPVSCDPGLEIPVFSESQKALAIRWFWRSGSKINLIVDLAESFSQSLALAQQIVELLITARNRGGV